MDSNFAAYKVREKCRKCEKNGEKTRFRRWARDEPRLISSQPRYDHFDISPYLIFIRLWHYTIEISLFQVFFDFFLYCEKMQNFINQGEDASIFLF